MAMKLLKEHIDTHRHLANKTQTAQPMVGKEGYQRFHEK